MRLFLRVGTINMLYLVVLVILFVMIYCFVAMLCHATAFIAIIMLFDYNWLLPLLTHSLCVKLCVYTIILRKRHTPLEYRLYCGIKYKYRMLCVSVLYTTCVPYIYTCRTVCKYVLYAYICMNQYV